MVTNVLLTGVLALLAAEVLLAAAIYRRLAGRTPETPAADRSGPDQAAEAELRRSREISEGIDALMTYSVKTARGTGGEGLC